MNLDEYKAYEQSFRDGMEGLTAFSSGSWLKECSECPTDVDYDDGVCYDAEPYFSWHQCDICGTAEGGNREDCHAYYDGGLIHLRVCDDCVYYAEYGRLNDATIQSIGESMAG